MTRLLAEIGSACYNPNLIIVPYIEQSTVEGVLDRMLHLGKITPMGVTSRRAVAQSVFKQSSLLIRFVLKVLDL
jgi:hypothetical protein